MTRILLLALIALATPLTAGGLVDKVFRTKIADDWYAQFQQWTAASTEGGRFIDTCFVVDGKATPYRISAVDGGHLVARQLRIEDESRSEVGEPVRFEWKQWLPKYIAGVYPTVTNEDDADLVAFALWLYRSAEDALVGNRVLTVLYERNEALRDDIVEFIRERHALKPRDRLEVCEHWDDEFASWRRVLLSEVEAAALRKEREQQEGAIQQLLNEYATPDKRTRTLAQLEFEIGIWVKKFAGSKTHEKLERRISQTSSDISTDQQKVTVLVELAEKQGDAWDKAAADFEKALRLDPCSPLLLSKAANAWMKHGKPEYLRNQWICTHESSIRKAKELYQRWLKREPDHTGVMEQLVTCHEILGERSKADRLREEIKRRE